MCQNAVYRSWRMLWVQGLYTNIGVQAIAEDYTYNFGLRKQITLQLEKLINEDLYIIKLMT